MRYIGIIAGLVCWLVLAVLAAPGLAAAKLKVTVSIPPQKYFVDQVGGDLVSVQVMVPPGANAHSYEPKPSQMVKLTGSQVYFALGIEFEEVWLEKFLDANPGMQVVDTGEKVHRVAMSAPHDQPPAKAGHHQAEHHGHDHHSGLDPHIWLAPKLAAIQARAMRDGLVKADPANQEAYDRNLAAFEKQLEDLHRELAAIFAGLGERRRVLVFHPAWGYFCRAYGLVQVAVEKGGKNPTAKSLTRLIQTAKKEKAGAIIVQPQFSIRSAQMVARAIDGQVIRLDPLAPDWAVNMRTIARQMKKAAY